MDGGGGVLAILVFDDYLAWGERSAVWASAGVHGLLRSVFEQGRIMG